MSILRTLALAVAVATLASGASPPRYAPEADGSSSLPSGWAPVSSRDTSLSLRVTVALKESGVTALLDHLALASDPQSAAYGAHLSLAELHSLVHVPDSRRATVEAWLVSEKVGAKVVARGRGFLVAELTMAAAEVAFETELAVYEHQGGERAAASRSVASVRAVRCAIGSRAYSIPMHLKQHIDLVDGLSLSRLPKYRVASGGRGGSVPQGGGSGGVQTEETGTAGGETDGKVNGKVDAARGEFNITPSVIKDMYNINGVPRPVPAPAGNLQAVVSFLQQYVEEGSAERREQRGGSRREREDI